jgi:hypothetical protein
VPLPLICDTHARTVDVKGAKRVWVRQPRSDLHKRQATVHLTIRAEGTQPKPILVFRGLGKRISRSESCAWDPRVHVLFQKSAWVDRTTALRITQLYKQDEAINTDQENLFFCDNLDAHTAPHFRRMLAEKCTGVLWLLPANKTDFFQPVDAGAGSHLKTLVAKRLEEKLENDADFLNRWCDGRFSASEYRILITQLVGQAFQDMCTAKETPFRRYFEKTGCLMTTDGGQDHLVAPEALGDLYSWSASRAHLAVLKELVNTASSRARN